MKAKKIALDYEREVRRLIAPFFAGRELSEEEMWEACRAEKVSRWLRANNPMLGGVSPLVMIVRGRGATLVKFVKNCLEDNAR